MSIALRPMTQQRWQTIRPDSINDYATRHVHSGRWRQQEAVEEATKEFDRLLPNGVDTDHHHLYDVVDTKSADTVGLLWFEVRHAETTPLIFVCELRVFEAFRRKGHAKATLGVLERVAYEEHGARRIGLHVFGDNLPARSLYAQVGFEEMHVLMAKDLAAPPATANGTPRASD